MYYVHGKYKVLSDTEQRFWEKVEGVNPTTGSLRSGGKDPATRCWEWKGHISNDGYGTFYFQTSRTRMAHRLAYELVLGPIPEGMVLDHLCRRRSCVNPKHLQPVTNLENIDRGSIGSVRRSHCSHGHPFDETNTIIRRDTKGRSKGQRCGICLQIHRVAPRESKDVLEWRRIESGHYVSRVHPFRVFRLGNKWFLEADGDVVHRVFETRVSAGMAAVIMLRLETWERQNRVSNGLRRDLLGCYVCQSQGRPIRSDVPKVPTT